MFDYLSSKNGTIYCLQDTHFDTGFADVVKHEWRGGAFLSFGSLQSRGTDILFDPKFDFTVHKTKIYQKGN